MTGMSKEAEQKINQLQMFEQSMQSILVQKQQFQNQLMEAESALGEIDGSKEVYKMIGNIMVLATKEDLKKDLQGKKEMLDLRIKSIEKQETQMKEKATKLQEEVLKQIKK